MAKTAKEYLALLDIAFQKHSLRSDLREGVRRVWNVFEREQGVSRPKNLEELMGDHYTYYDECFKRVLYALPAIHQEKAYYTAYHPIYNFNAFSNCTANNDFVIVIDEHLNSFFVQQFLCLFVYAFAKIDESKRELIIQYFEHNFKYFQNRSRLPSEEIRSYTMTFLQLAKEEYELMLWSSISGVAAFFFIFSHELGHHILGHTGRGTRYMLPDIAVEDYSFEKEYEADHFGMQHFLKIVAEEADYTFLNITSDFDRIPLIVLKIMAYYEQWLLKQGVETNKNSHPPSAKRLERILTASYAFDDSRKHAIYHPIEVSLDEIANRIGLTSI